MAESSEQMPAVVCCTVRRSIESLLAPLVEAVALAVGCRPRRRGMRTLGCGVVVVVVVVVAVAGVDQGNMGPETESVVRACMLAAEQGSCEEQEEEEQQ